MELTGFTSWPLHNDVEGILWRLFPKDIRYNICRILQLNIQIFVEGFEAFRKSIERSYGDWSVKLLVCFSVSPKGNHNVSIAPSRVLYKIFRANVAKSPFLENELFQGMDVGAVRNGNLEGHRIAIDKRPQRKRFIL